jgi:hypothetical protein
LSAAGKSSRGRIAGDAEDHEPLTDLLTVFLGLGVITANGNVREINWTLGNYSGWRISKRGYLDMRIYGYALARFAQDRREDIRRLSRELRLDVRTSFKQAIRFLDWESSRP